ncbi:MAG: hypothetical protein ACK42D_00075 [Candidatus Paceibacteria bacterium]
MTQSSQVQKLHEELKKAKVCNVVVSRSLPLLYKLLSGLSEGVYGPYRLGRHDLGEGLGGKCWVSISLGSQQIVTMIETHPNVVRFVHWRWDLQIHLMNTLGPAYVQSIKQRKVEDDDPFSRLRQSLYVDGDAIHSAINKVLAQPST